MTIPPVRIAAYFFSAFVHAGVVGAALLAPDYQPPRIAERAAIEVDLVAGLPGGRLENAAKDPVDATPSKAIKAVREKKQAPKAVDARIQHASLPEAAQRRPDLAATPAPLPPPSPRSEKTAPPSPPVTRAALSPSAGAVPSKAAAKAAEPGPGVAPSLLANPKPPYPKRARKRGIEGRVLLRVRVDVAGNSATVKMLQSSGHAMLDTAAVKAVRKWRFVPAQRNGVPVAATLDIPIAFQIKN